MNVLLANKYKVRALVDSGATSSMISTGLVDLMKMRSAMHATSFSFFGVGEELMKFAGIFYKFQV